MLEKRYVMLAISKQCMYTEYQWIVLNIYLTLNSESYTKSIQLNFLDKKDLLSECIADMIHHGTYDDKKVVVIPRLGGNITSKTYSWEELSKMGPCMVDILYINTSD